ncbi:MAG: HPr(Ser) kinase/phosphatase [Pedosphaera sp. Tous-C6FEB]|nr:MAG: HPr(Ser) kinase/phosphatase [Pedosphaera sp. Tous-C6FEB]
MNREAITVERFYTGNSARLDLKLLGGAAGLKRTIREPTVNRPGLALAGHTKYFARHRVQVMGHAEVTYLKTLPRAEREERYAMLFGYKLPCVVFCRDLPPDRDCLRAAEARNIPILRSSLITMKFINLATLALEQLFAPRASEMGSLVDIHGVGVLIRGDSGIGKSESILALIERGYSLVADDVTRVMLVDGRDVVGTSSELTRNHMEIRGIGIVNVAAMFGAKSIRQEKRIDLIVTLKAWDEVKDVDRLGMEEAHMEILGMPLPHMTIPVRPGRDLARLIEVAALHTKLRRAGHNPAKELNERLVAQMAGPPRGL